MGVFTRHSSVQQTTTEARMPMRDPLTISPEEDEEQMIMRRLRNSCDELRRGYRWLDYRKQKAEQSRENRENIELPEEKVSVRGEPIPFKAYIPMDEVIQYRKDQKASGGRMVYKGIKLNNRTMHNFRPTIGQFVSTYNICFATRVA